MENSNKGRQQLLRRALLANASFSTISGLVLVFAERWVVRLLGLPETINLCAQPVRVPVQSKGEWLAILWLKVVSTTPLKRPNWFARDCAPTVQSKSKKNISARCARQKANGWRLRRFLPVIRAN
jgi:hypothetical protein